MARHAIDWVLLDHAAARPVAVGDKVSADAGGMPIYEVTALTPGEIWIEDDRHHAARQISSLAAFRWKGAAH